jgi:hypothetical protein
MRTVSLGKSKGPPWKIFCPACKCIHVFAEGTAFNMDFDFPTFLPALLVKTFDESGKAYVCHGLIKDGNVTFLDDTTHNLRGKTVTLPEFIV